MHATVYSVPSASQRGETYKVTFFEDTTVQCECKAFTFSKSGDCKHIQALKREGKRYQAPQATKVFRLSYGGNEVVLVDDEDFGSSVDRAIDALAVRKALTIERIA